MFAISYLYAEFAETTVLPKNQEDINGFIIN